MRESVFSIIFKGRSENISFCNWIKYLLLEIYLGEQLLEMISTTAAYNEGEQYKKTGQIEFGDKINGWSKGLVFFIPSTTINKLLCSSITALLFNKYVSHYELLAKRDSNTEPESNEPCYGLNHDKIYLLTELKLAYNTIWVAMNITIDIVVFLSTKDVAITVATGAFIEFIRRFKW